MNSLVFLYITVVIFCFSVASRSNKEDLTQIHKRNETNEKKLELVDNTIRPKYNEFPCTLYSIPDRIINVHNLTPADVSVVAAIGDSVTAGMGIKASNPINNFQHYRGLAFSIGGDGSFEDHVTLPNILKKYNPNLKGFSVSSGTAMQDNSHLNVAVVADSSFGIPRQVRTLLRRMRRRSEGIDFENDWKVITIYMGANNLCHYCQFSTYYSVNNYTRSLQEGLDILHEELPRAFVNLIPISRVHEISEIIGDRYCETVDWLMCQCASYAEGIKMMAEAEELYQQAAIDLVSSGRYDTHDNFTVVVQPFSIETRIPRTADGKTDFSYFAIDCFHWNEKLHGAAAEALWTNMIEPVGMKRNKWDFQRDTMDCPTADRPYFYTRLNSELDNSGNTGANKMSENTEVSEDVQIFISAVGGTVVIVVLVSAVVAIRACKKIRKKEGI